MAILITGASRGIGHGLLELYTDRGETVIGTSRAGKSPLLQLDVTDVGSHTELASRLNNTAIDLLICNAGVYADKSEALDTGFPPELWATTFATNVTGVFQTVQTLLPNLKSAKSPRIAIISSQMASHTNANGGSYIYRASKAAVLNLGRNLATDLHSHGIAVGIYHPGWVVTDMGGNNADISVKSSVSGLASQFAQLSLSTTGCFLRWDGTELPY